MPLLSLSPAIASPTAWQQGDTSASENSTLTAHHTSAQPGLASEVIKSRHGRQHWLPPARSSARDPQHDLQRGLCSRKPSRSRAERCQGIRAKSQHSAHMLTDPTRSSRDPRFPDKAVLGQHRLCCRRSGSKAAESIPSTALCPRQHRRLQVPQSPENPHTSPQYANDCADHLPPEKMRDHHLQRPRTRHLGNDSLPPCCQPQHDGGRAASD